MQLTYAGIGSRKTPQPILNAMCEIGDCLADRSWFLRTGFADGADKAFAYGAERYGEERGMMLNYLPWKGYNGAPVDDDRFITLPASGAAVSLAAMHHPAWNQLTDAAKLLHIRNGYILLGSDLMKPVDMVVCWTPNGKAEGGTGQALRIAAYCSIPVFNLYFTEHQKALIDFVGRLEKELTNVREQTVGDS